MVGLQSGKEAASWIPMQKDKTRSWTSRRISSLILVQRKVFRREVHARSGGCEDSVFDDTGSVVMFVSCTGVDCFYLNRSYICINYCIRDW